MIFVGQALWGDENLLQGGVIGGMEVPDKGI